MKPSGSKQKLQALGDLKKISPRHNMIVPANFDEIKELERKLAQDAEKKDSTRAEKEARKLENLKRIKESQFTSFTGTSAWSETQEHHDVGGNQDGKEGQDRYLAYDDEMSPPKNKTTKAIPEIVVEESDEYKPET